MQKNTFPIATKYAAYAGLMFFGFLVEKKLKTDFQNFSQQERDFIADRCQIGTFSLGGVAIFVLLFALGEWSAFSIFSSLAMVVLLMIILVQVLGILLIFLDLSIRGQKIDLTPDQKQQLFFLFIPGISEKSWFSLADFSKPNRWLKEAQLRWRLIAFSLLLFPWAAVGMVVGAFLILRIFLLYQGQDWIPTKIKTLLNLSYSKYIEELCFIPYLMLRQLKHREIGFKLDALQDLQHRSQTSNFFGGWKWIMSFGLFLSLVAIFGLWTGMRWKLFPLLRWILRRVMIKK